jgi:hypothetical protein
MLGYYRESGDPMVALAFQHQSAFGVHGYHYVENDALNPLGWSGASANGQDWGGEVHLHWHGLTAAGQRVNPLAYLQSASAGGGGTTPIPDEEENEDMAKNVSVWYKKANENTYIYFVFNTESGFQHEFGNGVNNGSMPGGYTAGVSKAFDTAGWSEVTEGHASVIKQGLAAVRPKDAPTSFQVEVIDPGTLAKYN